MSRAELSGSNVASTIEIPVTIRSQMAAPSLSYATHNPSRSTETAREMSAIRTAEPFGEGVPFGDVRTS